MKKNPNNMKKNNYNVKKTNSSKNNILAYILLVLFIFWTIGSLCAFVLTARSCKDDSVITASADYVQPTEYASGNLIKSSDIYASGSYGQITWTVRDDGTILLNGTTDRTHTFPVFRKYAVPSFMTVGESYTFSSNELQLNRLSLVHSRTVNGTTTSTGYTVNDVTFTLEANTTYIDFYYYIYANQTFDNVVLKPMLNQGSVSYPFQPNYEYFYNQGESDGYESGRADGIMKGNISFLYDSTVTATYTSSGIPNFTKTGQTTVVGEHVYLTGVADQLLSGATGIYIRIDLSAPTLGREIYWTAYGNRSAFYDGDTPKLFTAVMSDGSRYNARWYYLEDDQCYGLQVQDVGYDVYLSYLSGWYVGSLTDMKSVYFRAPDSAYRSGYDMGYNAGLEDNTRYNEAYQNGINAGYTNGYAAGKNYGIELANTYSFESLLSAVFDVPIKAFRGLTNFEILGVNLSGFYLSLLTACFVLVIVKIVM